MHRVLVAVSAGPDSVVLLHVLNQLQPCMQGEVAWLQVAHFNHHLRGEASEADEQYVRQVATSLHLPFYLGSATTLSPTQSHLEASARMLRYRWLLDTAVSLGCNAIVTGHTMNDQAETVLHHLVRGTGWRGLRGIAPVRMLGKGVHVIRPLLSCTRQEILDYAQMHGLTPRHDASNNDVRFTRNRIRHQILPKLIESSSEAIAHLAGWAETARTYYAQLRRTAKLMLPVVLAYVDSRQLAIHRSELTTVNDEILQEVLRLLWSRQHWPVDQMNARRWREVIEVCRGTRTAVELPGKIIVKRKKLVIQFIQQ